MSLDSIRKLRLAGQKPSGVVTVLLGQRPRWFADDATSVIVRPVDDPRLMDWRPLVGLWVAVFVAGTQPDRFLALLQALEAAGVKFFGAADEAGTYPLVVDATDQHHNNLYRTWVALCR